MGMHQRADEDLDEISEINLTPFIDVILVMLIIFMIAAQTSAVSQSVDLPGSRAEPLPQERKPITVTVRADQSFAIDDKPVAADRLGPTLVAGGAKPDDRILLLGDRALPYEGVMHALDTLRAAGFTRIALVGRERQQD